MFIGSGEIKLIGSGNSLNSYSWDGDRYNYSGTITINGATISGEVILNGGASGASIAQKIIGSGNSMNFYRQEDGTEIYLGTITINGATVSGGTNGYIVGLSTQASGNTLSFYSNGDYAGSLTFTSTNYTCPLTGGCACSGNLSTCSAPSPESCSPINTCATGYTLNGDVCVAEHICPSGTKLDTSTDTCGFANYVWKETYFDGFGRAFKTRMEGPEGKIITAQSVMNNRGLLERSSVPYFEGIETPRWVYYTYDPIGRTTQVTNTDGTTVKSSYMQGRITNIDANGHVKVEERDVYARLVKVEEYTGTYPSVNLYATTTYEYDILGNLLKTTDTKGNQTTLTYDTLGRKTEMTDPDMGHWQYTYDANGNLISQTDAKGQTITFTYDALNRIKTKHYPTGQDVVYTYDETTSTNSKGQLTTVTDATGQEKYYYDQLGRTTKFIKTIDGIQYTTENTYDSLGRTTSIKYPDGETINYSYDQAGNLVQVPGYVTYSNFNALGQAATITYANGVTTQYQYNTNNNRLYSITTNSPVSGGLQNLAYTYDNIGNITTITDVMDNTRTQNFTYDDINRLTQAQSTSYSTLTYNYDQIGNMTYNSQMGSYIYGTKPHAVVQAGTNTYTYDANGNMITRPGQTITYDYDNKPIAINSTTFVYDYSGSRIKKNNTIHIGKGYECTNGDCIKYIFAGSNRIATKTASTTYYYHTDHLGSSSIITDASGAKTEETYYYPYGGTRQHTGSTNLKHKYTGQEEDTETGLYYYGARYYDPQLARFISADTIVPIFSDPQTFNRYSYAGNNPIIYTDPSGHEPVLIAMAICAAMGAVMAGIQSDWDWGEMFAGGVMGAMTGAAGYGAYSMSNAMLSQAVSTTWSAIGAGAIAGAYGGGMAVAMNGGDIGRGLLYGAIGGAVGGGAGGICKAYNIGSQASAVIQISSAAMIGGIISELNGGAFSQGAIIAAGAAAASIGLNEMGKTAQNDGTTGVGEDADTKARADQIVDGLKERLNNLRNPLASHEELVAGGKWGWYKGTPYRPGSEVDPMQKILDPNYKPQGVNNLPGQQMSPSKSAPKAGTIGSFLLRLLNSFMRPVFITVPSPITNPMLYDPAYQDYYKEGKY